MNNRVLAVVVASAVLFLTLVYSVYFISSPERAANASGKSGRVIVIDAGHGGLDGGAVGVNGVSEKDINLSIAIKLNEILISLGYDTRMTRCEDISLHDEDCKTVREKKTSDLHNRMAIMNENDNSIFVSIHQNSYIGESSWGTQVFYSVNNPESFELAQSVQSAVISDLQPENKRLVKASGDSIYLLYKADKPAIMVECGFLSNPGDCELLCSSEYRDNMAFCIAAGITEYLKNSAVE